jgi:hypothetical protein
MTLSAEMTRFLADHATAESWAAFASGIETPPTAATLAGAMSAKGYQVGEAEVTAALKFSKQSPMADRQLDAVVGGQGTNPSAEDTTKEMRDIIRDVREKLSQMEAARNETERAIYKDI